MESVYPIKASILGAGLAKSIKALNCRIWWGEGYCINTIPDTLMFSLRVWGSRMETQCKTPTVDDVKDENFSENGPRSNQQVQVSCGQMLVPQSRQSRHNIRRERAVSDNDRSVTTQLQQIEASRAVLEGRETMDPSFRIRGRELRSGSFLRLRQTKKRGNRQALESRSWDDIFWKRTQAHRKSIA